MHMIKCLLETQIALPRKVERFMEDVVQIVFPVVLSGFGGTMASGSGQGSEVEWQADVAKYTGEGVTLRDLAGDVNEILISEVESNPSYYATNHLTALVMSIVEEIHYLPSSSQLRQLQSSSKRLRPTKRAVVRDELNENGGMGEGKSKGDGEGGEIEREGWFHRDREDVFKEDDDEVMLPRICALDWLELLFSQCTSDSGEIDGIGKERKDEFMQMVTGPLLQQFQTRPPEIIVERTLKALVKCSGDQYLSKTVQSFIDLIKR